MGGWVSTKKDSVFWVVCCGGEGGEEVVHRRMKIATCLYTYRGQFGGLAGVRRGGGVRDWSKVQTRMCFWFHAFSGVVRAKQATTGNQGPQTPALSVDKGMPCTRGGGPGMGWLPGGLAARCQPWPMQVANTPPHFCMPLHPLLDLFRPQKGIQGRNKSTNVFL